MLYHTSANADLESCDFKPWNGVFGSFLFFSANVYTTTETEYFIYAIDEESLSICDASDLYFNHDENDNNQNEIIRECAELHGVDIEIALLYLSEKSNAELIDAETSWETQKLTACLAKAQGFDGVRVTDEQGAAYMVDMGRRHESFKKNSEAA
jgi:hypothetical protein